jgi:hypothetical protein
MSRGTRPGFGIGSLLLVLGLFGMAPSARADEPKAIEIGARRELFVDDFLIDRRDGQGLRLQSPAPREIVLEHNAPSEGSCGRSSGRGNRETWPSSGSCSTPGCGSRSCAN